MPGRKYASAWSEASPPPCPLRQAKKAPIPMPKRLFTTNCTLERETSRTASRTSAAATLMTTASLRSRVVSCLLYTSDAADDLLCVDLGGRRIIKKKKKKQTK